jgi:L-asparaginase/beta-aspartyl-peptidase (threonine type)
MLRLLVQGGVGSPGEWKDGTDKALQAALKSIDDGGSALDACIAATMVMENDERFNAGTGSRVRTDGSIQMDAAVMVPGKFGAVAAIEGVRHPVLIARKVMEDSPHVFLCGRGANEFARRHGFKEYSPYTMRTIVRRNDLVVKAKKGQLKDTPSPEFWEKYSNDNCDTVGAICCLDGNMATAISTGGAGLMLPGRVGDSPMIGCGVYVDEDAAVQTTGIGEEIIRRLAAYKVHQMIPNFGAQGACDRMVKEFPPGITIGVIATTKKEIGFAASKDMPCSIEVRE